MNNLNEVVPAILTDDPKALENMVHQAETFTNWVQFDIMDGRFVQSRSISHQQLARLPMKISWEAHLMVEEPENYLEDFKKAGAQKVIFHHEATCSPEEVIAVARGLGLEIGLAINPDTPISAILSLTDKVDSILFLSVYPGFYGRTFIPEVLDKIIEFKGLYPDKETGIDGGVKEGNITQIAKTGINFIYAGSAIFHQNNPADSYRHLSILAREASASL